MENKLWYDSTGKQFVARTSLSDLPGRDMVALFLDLLKLGELDEVVREIPEELKDGVSLVIKGIYQNLWDK